MLSSSSIDCIRYKKMSEGVQEIYVLSVSLTIVSRHSTVFCTKEHEAEIIGKIIVPSCVENIYRFQLLFLVLKSKTLIIYSSFAHQN